MQHVWSKNPQGFCGGFLCDTCEELVKEAIDTGKLKTEIKDFLVNFCKNDVSDLSTTCQYIANHDLMPFLDKFLDSTAPQKICSLFDMCSSTSSTVDKLKEILAPGIVQNVLNHDTIKDSLAPGVVRKPNLHTITEKIQTNKEDSLSCIVCSVLVGKIDSAIGNQKTEDKIVAETDRFCKYLPQRLSRECQSYVNQFGPPILQALLQYLPAKQVCAYYINACPKSTLGNYGVELVAPTKLASSFCVACEVAVRMNEILNGFKVLCNTKVPAGELRQACKESLANVKLIFQMLNSDISPSKACQFLSLCKESEMAPKTLNVCRLGPSLWCGTKMTAQMCKKQHYCGYQ
ncbi:expressed hypothetical protein [Trichoplax adhaerens]|uniref:Saposin B-type domain-containing protein n=1 Tax=Trichoplax adhaerens TaxID=10228 RepID=B3SAR7_TRIAD|nr:expressed hypothetical protein [Trichoplax adhaerens]EDV20148.1 expressed hypothetical protein [Trichoplax adhaerens]|eukprot:XP_002117309.1 expressed hypothetical protein [Trichoplax adhaerens]